MKKLLLISILIIILFLVKPVNAISELHTEGRYIKNETGHIIFLRGVNKPTFSSYTDGWWQPEGGIYASGVGVWDPDAVAYNLDKMKELLDANVVRLHINVPYWVDNTDNYRDHLKTTISLANDRGMYVIVSGFNNGEGGVGGQSYLPWSQCYYYGTQSECEDSESVPPAWECYWENGICNTTAASLYYVDDFIEWMSDDTNSISSELSSYPNVIYEFWNEPVGVLTRRRTFFDACQNILDALRAKGDDHLVLYQYGYTGMESNYDISLGYTLNYAPDPTRNNVVYSIHTYRWILDHYTYFGYDDYTYDRVEAIMLPVYPDGLGVQVLLDNNLPWINGEFGAAIGGQFHVPEEDQWREIEWYRNLLEFMNNYEGGYTHFLWWDVSRNYPLLQDSIIPGNEWCPPLNEPGEILRDAIHVPYSFISGRLTDITYVPVQANIIAYQEGTDIEVNSTQTSDGYYNFLVFPDVYDLQFSISNFFISNFFIKLLSLDISSNLTDVTNYITNINNQNVSFTADITNSQLIQTYSSERPARVLINGTPISNVSSYSQLTDNTWFYNSTENRLYLMVGSFVSECSCGEWTNQGCGLGGCADNEQYQTRSCSPTDCDIISQCVYDESCVPITPSEWYTCSQIWGFSCSNVPDSDNTFDTCPTSSSSGNHVDEVYINASTASPGETVNVICTFSPIDSRSTETIWYWNTNGWTRLLNRSATTSGYAEENVSVSFSVDNYVGQHWIRCSIVGLGTGANNCDTSTSWYDHDDVNFMVS